MTIMASSINSEPGAKLRFLAPNPKIRGGASMADAWRRPPPIGRPHFPELFLYRSQDSLVRRSWARARNEAASPVSCAARRAEARKVNLYA